MPEHVEHKEIAGELFSPASVLADMERVLALAERWLRPADQLDYRVRRWVLPVPFEDNRSVAPTPLLRRSLLLKQPWRVSQSMPHKRASMRSSGPLSEVQAAIGRHLRAQYALERSMPAQLANLLDQFEQSPDGRVSGMIRNEPGRVNAAISKTRNARRSQPE